MIHTSVADLLPIVPMRLLKHLALPIRRPSSSPTQIVTRVPPSPITRHSQPTKPTPPQTGNRKQFIILKLVPHNSINIKAPHKVVPAPQSSRGAPPTIKTISIPDPLKNRNSPNTTTKFPYVCPTSYSL